LAERAARSASALQKTAITLSAVLLVTLLANTLRLAKLPLRVLLKDELSFTPERMAGFLALIGLAWYLKPLAGLLSDHVPLYGTRRRHYLLLSGGAGALAWLVATAYPHATTTLLIALIAVNLFAVLGNTVGGGLLVDAGRAQSATGLLSAVRLAAMNLAAVVAGPIGGWLAGRAFVWTCLAGALLMSTMFVAVASLPAQEAPQTPAPLATTLRDIAVHLKDRRVWSVAVLTLAFYIAPGYQTLWFYHQQDFLRLSVQEIGLLEALQALGGIAGAACYAGWSSRVGLRTTLPAGIVLNGACVGLYAFYDSFAAALVIEPLLGFCVCIGVLPLCELTARASPPRHEAFVFAAIFGLGNMAMAMADVLGTRMASALGLELPALFSLYAACTAASAVLVLAVPPALLDGLAVATRRESSSGSADDGATNGAS